MGVYPTFKSVLSLYSELIVWIRVASCTNKLTKEIILYSKYVFHQENHVYAFQIQFYMFIVCFKIFLSCNVTSSFEWIVENYHFHIHHVSIDLISTLLSAHYNISVERVCSFEYFGWIKCLRIVCIVYNLKITHFNADFVMIKLT